MKTTFIAIINHQPIEKIKQIKQSYPEVLFDGTFQYDAALNIHLAKTKVPNNPIAEKANVFISPDLNTGNMTYKAVKHSTNVLSISQILQSLRKLVNDLSRAATVDDIVFTITITAIQPT